MQKNLVLTLATLLLLTQASAFEFCNDGTIGENNLRLISVDDMLKENSKEWVWEPFQKIEVEIRIENKNDEGADYIIEAIFKDGDETIKIAENSDNLEKGFSLSANERKSISLEFEIDEDVDTENYDLYIKFYKESDENEECVENSEEEITIEKIEVCENGRVDDDELELQKIRDGTEDNEEEWRWAPGDNIEISLELENKDYSERDFVVELIFLDENNEEVFLVDNSDNTYEETSLDEDESDELNFYFKLKSDIEEASYTLYAKAHDKDNEDICTSLKAEEKSNPITLEIKRDERKVTVTEVEGPSDITTASQAEYATTITNFGSEDEDRVLIIAYNYQLNIREDIEIQNFNSGDEQTVTFTITIPENASLSRHALAFSTEYEYNEKQDYYRSASDEDDDIKHYITITQGAIKEVEEVENETIEKNETIIENETETPTTLITGNAIGIPSKSPNWIILGILIILAIIGIVLFFKRPHTHKETQIEPPQVIRKYTAKLN